MNKTFQLNRTQTIMLLVSKMAEEQDQLTRLNYAIEIMNLFKDEETERYLRSYYEGN